MSDTVVSRPNLIKLLKTLGSLDPQGLSPFVGIQLASDQVNAFRTGLLGYARTLSSIPSHGEWLHCSANHLMECLRVFQGEQVVLSNSRGVLMLSEADPTFKTELRVYTVPKERAGHKSHRPGADVLRPDPSWFSQCHVSAVPITPGAPSVLEGSVLRMVTPYGAVFYTGPEEIKTPSHPRTSTLNLYGGKTFEELTITETGYYRSVLEGVEVVTAGYKPTADYFAAYKGPAREMARYPAARLLYALGAAASVAALTGSVVVNASEGVTTRDAHGNLDKFGVTAQGAHPTFTLSPKAAKTIADILEQAKDASEAILSALPGGILRLSAGSWDFSFKATINAS